MSPTRNRTSRRPRRHGAALVELSVCLPVLILLVMGSIEAAQAIYLKQSLVTAAYEAVREATDKSGTAASARAKGELILDQRNIRLASISFSPANIASVPRGGVITVTVSAPCQANMPISTRFLTANSLTAQATMVKEGLP